MNVGMDIPMLRLSNVDAGYGKKQILFGVSLTVGRGEIVAMIGHNGAGKTTILRSVFGHVRPSHGEVLLGGNDIGKWTMSDRVHQGMTYIPQDNFVFGALTVQENLELAAYRRSGRRKFPEHLIECFEYMPILKERRSQRAGTLSGGQKRILSLGMVLIFRPMMLLLDEPSLGLSPNLVDSAMKLLENMTKGIGMTVLLVEQNVRKAFEVADRVYVLRGGRIIAERHGGDIGSHKELLDLF